MYNVINLLVLDKVDHYVFVEILRKTYTPKRMIVDESWPYHSAIDRWTSTIKTNLLKEFRKPKHPFTAT